MAAPTPLAVVIFPSVTNRNRQDLRAGKFLLKSRIADRLFPLQQSETAQYAGRRADSRNSASLLIFLRSRLQSFPALSQISGSGHSAGQQIYIAAAAVHFLYLCIRSNLYLVGNL